MALAFRLARGKSGLIFLVTVTCHFSYADDNVLLEVFLSAFVFVFCFLFYFYSIAQPLVNDIRSKNYYNLKTTNITRTLAIAT